MTKVKKETVAKLLQEAVDKGATTAEEIHRSIADLPLKVLDNMGIAQETTENVKKLSDASIGAIYQLVHDINHQVTDLADDFIKKAAKQKKAVAKPKAKAKAKAKRKTKA